MLQVKWQKRCWFCGLEVETLKLCEIMEVKRYVKRSGRAVNAVDCVGCYEVLVALCGSCTNCELLVHSVGAKGGSWGMAPFVISALDEDD